MKAEGQVNMMIRKRPESHGTNELRTYESAIKKLLVCMLNEKQSYI